MILDAEETFQWIKHIQKQVNSEYKLTSSFTEYRSPKKKCYRNTFPLGKGKLHSKILRIFVIKVRKTYRIIENSLASVIPYQ